MARECMSSNYKKCEYYGGRQMNILKWDSEISERIRLRLGWSHYAMYWFSFINGIALTCLVLWLMC